MAKERVERLRLVCEACGIEFVVLPSGIERRFCSRSCRDERGERGAPAWKVDLFASMDVEELASYCSAMLSAYERGGQWAPHEAADDDEREVLEGAVIELRTGAWPAGVPV